jgi:hypothetical protein
VRRLPSTLSAMIPLRIVESEREGFDQPVVELWRDDEFIGMVFWDGDVVVAQIYPDDAGDVHDLEARDLMRVLELAERIVAPDEYESEDEEGFSIRIGSDESDGDDWGDEDPATLQLVEEFDPQAVHRTSDGEGFFLQPVAEAFIERCEELGLAVVEMEGFDLEGESLVPRPNLTLTVRAPGIDEWGLFRSVANGQARDTLASWRSRPTLVVAFVVQEPGGDTFVA